jgi:elongation factor Ts
VPADVLEPERLIFEQITRDEGKPEAAIAKIVDGRVGGFYKEVVLTEQAFVKDNKQSIAAVLKAGGVDVQGFARFQVGQA